MKNLLILSQAISQNYLDILINAFGINEKVTVITGSQVVASDHMEIVQCPPHNPKSIKSRLMCWLEYYLFVQKWLKKNKTNHYDIIFATSNPPINSYLCTSILKKKFKAPFIYMNWDLYPQIIEEKYKGNIAIQSICRIWSIINKKTYGHIDQMLTIGEIMANSINEPLDKPINIKVVPIGTDSRKIRPIEKAENTFCVQKALMSKFVVLYSGKMGYGHNIQMILDSCMLLKEYKDIQFVFVGYGPGYQTVEDYIKKNKPNNVLLFPLQSAEIFPFSIACGDVGLVSQERDLAHLFMPSKTYDMMATGMAILGICSGADDLSGLIDQSNNGLYIASNNSRDLADAILRLYNDRQLLDQYKSNSRRTATEKYDKEIIEEMYRDTFQKFLMKSLNLRGC